MAPAPLLPDYAAIRARRIAGRRESARQALLAADVVARNAGGRLLVFGSLAEGGFDERSDIDVALLGLPADRDEIVAARIDEALEAAGFECDVITERSLPESLKERVLAHGIEPRALG